MKKIIVCMLFCCLLSSCSVVNGSISEESEDMSMNCENEEKVVDDEGVFEGVISYWSVDFNDTTGAYLDFVLDEVTAFKIGDAILKKVFGEEKIKNTTFTVCEIKGEGYFVVTRLPVPRIPGGEYNVAINKEDGKILKIWTGE